MAHCQECRIATGSTFAEFPLSPAFFSSLQKDRKLCDWNFSGNDYLTLEWFSYLSHSIFWTNVIMPCIHVRQRKNRMKTKIDALDFFSQKEDWNRQLEWNQTTHQLEIIRASLHYLPESAKEHHRITLVRLLNSLCRLLSSAHYRRPEKSVAESSSLILFFL